MPMLSSGEGRVLRVGGGHFCVPPGDAGVGGGCGDELSPTLTAPVMKGR